MDSMAPQKSHIVLNSGTTMLTSLQVIHKAMLTVAPELVELSLC